MIKIYRKPEPGERFVIGADPAEGGDYSSFVVVSRKYSEVVISSKSKEESSQLGYTLNGVANWLKNNTGHFPLVAVERNTGTATIFVLKELNYPNIYKAPKSFLKNYEERDEKYGWSTNQATRPKMLDDLALTIRQKAINIPCADIVNEMFTFIRNEKTGKPEAERGSNDDLVMALAIAWQVRQLSVEEKSDMVNLTVAKNKKYKEKFTSILG